MTSRPMLPGGRARVACLSLLILGVVAALPAGAQDGKPPPKVPSEPAVTTASYGDWLMRCQSTVTPAKPVRLCEVAQSIQVQGQSAPIAQVAIGRASPGDTLHVIVVVPTNVGFPSEAHIVVSDKDAPGNALGWRRCVPGGCVAESTVKDDVLRRWRDAPAAGRVVFTDAGGRSIAIPLSFRGLAQALDALDRERSRGNASGK